MDDETYYRVRIQEKEFLLYASDPEAAAARAKYRAEALVVELDEETGEEVGGVRLY